MVTVKSNWIFCPTASVGCWEICLACTGICHVPADPIGLTIGGATSGASAVIIAPGDDPGCFIVHTITNGPFIIGEFLAIIDFDWGAFIIDSVSRTPCP